MAIHPSVGPVTTVRCLITRAGTTSQCNADLIFIAHKPVVVIEWEKHPDGDFPAIIVSLDHKYLHRVGSEKAEYVYENAIPDPRPPE